MIFRCHIFRRPAIRPCAALLAFAALLTVPLALVRAEPIVMTDLEGRTVTLEKPAERVAAIPIPMASILIAMGQGTKSLAGMNRIAKTAMLEGILGKIFPETADIRADIAGQNFMPNVEALAAARPDLVIQWGGRGDDIVKPLTNAGLNTMLILYGTEDYARRYITLAATAIGKPERAAANIAWRRSVEAEIGAKVRAIPPAQKPRVLHLSRAMTAMAASGRGSYEDASITLAGGENVAAALNDVMPVNRERIAAWDPEVIFLNGFEEELTPEFIYKDPILSQTAAARTKRVYKYPLGGYRWDPPNQESPLTWMWLANLLHPKVFAFDLRGEIRMRFRELYAYELKDTEIDGILRLPIHASAAGYDALRSR
ncbi:MAG: iron complex transport system substrate-binding [Beijerinckiaceae bacterium]|nr:MAG: iron complex transport system substrate-binding [Beijerinckiaceae bacterium]